MLRNLAKLMSILLVLSQLNPAFASNDISAKRFLACEENLLRQEKFEVAIGKERKQSTPDRKRIRDLSQTLTYLERLTGQYCNNFSAQAF